MNAVRHDAYKPVGVIGRTPTWCLCGWRPALPNSMRTRTQWEAHMREVERKADDARLAEAAHDLLEAAQAILAYGDGLADLLTTDDLRMVKDAVAKATGEPA